MTVMMVMAQYVLIRCFNSEQTNQQQKFWD